MRAVAGNIVQYDCNSSYWSEQFLRQDVGGGYYILEKRNTGTCLRVENGSSSDGASIILSTCKSGWWSQQFTFSSAGSRKAEEQVIMPDDYKVRLYPNPATNRSTIEFSTEEVSGSYKLISPSGSVNRPFSFFAA